MSVIRSIVAREILDSRGNPTIEAEVTLDAHVRGRAAVPSGASTGAHEAVELRDGDKNRYVGKGVLRAVENVNNIIAPALVGEDVFQQRRIDQILINLDPQEFMIIPGGAKVFSESLRMGVEIFHCLKAVLKARGYTTSVGDEGGFAPNVKSNEEALDLIVEAIQKAGYKPGEQVSLALDVAASEFYESGRYHFKKSTGLRLSAEEMIGLYERWTKEYPIVSIEDGMAEDDWQGWIALTEALGEKIQLVGDDVFVTNTSRLEKGIADGVANSILIKLNQVGTLSETMDTIELTKTDSYTTVISHRSGDTEDAVTADL